MDPAPVTARELTEPVLRALVAEVAEDGAQARVVAVAAPPTWEGDPVVDTDHGKVRVVPCVSPLAVREALVEYGGGDELLVLLTDHDEHVLGDEVRARLWQRRIVRPSAWEALKQLFHADRLAPQLADHRWVVDLLVDVAPTRGYPPVAGAFLDLDTAWRTLHRHALGLENDRPTLDELVRWGGTGEARAALDRLSTDNRQRMSAHLMDVAGPVAAHLTRLAAAGQGHEIVPLGLVADVLWQHEATDDPDVIGARARFEQPLGSRELTPAAAREWGRAAVGVVRSTVGSHDAQVAAWSARAEHLLTDLGALGHAIGSDVLPRGFDLRLDMAGSALSAVVRERSDEALRALEAGLGHVRAHLRADTSADRSRVIALEAAVRLARRLAHPPQPVTDDLASHSAAYVSDGAWVDMARRTIEGEAATTLASAYAELLDAIDALRGERDRSFAEATRRWAEVAPADGSTVLPIERVLDDVVAPIAQQQPTLLLVVDGMGHADANRLVPDVLRKGWRPLEPDGGSRYVVAAFPTVTNVSRASLLTGELTTGDQVVERDRFTNHTGLRDAAGAPPVLFHKRDLADDGADAAREPHEAILDREQRLVGVVVNAVDDHLAKGAQLRLADGLEGIKPLGPLLDAAAEAGRTVIITSDHGHVLEHGSQVKKGDGGERWRSTASGPDEDEVLVRGPRVLRGEGAVVMPATDGLRYNPEKKHGYHGGATPAEVLCPLLVVVPADVQLDGWVPAYPSRPLWWDRAGSMPDMPSVATSSLRPSEDERGQPVLFATAEDQTPQPQRPPWLHQLLESPLLDQQRQLAGRAALDDEELAQLLHLVVAGSGTLSGTAIANATGLPAHRVRSKLDALRRLLNVDGYEVVQLDSDNTVHVSRPLLATQFGIDEP